MGFYEAISGMCIFAGLKIKKKIYHPHFESTRTGGRMPQNTDLVVFEQSVIRPIYLHEADGLSMQTSQLGLTSNPMS